MRNEINLDIILDEIGIMVKENTFAVRDKTISKYGYFNITRDVYNELKEELRNYKIETFVDILSGYGLLALILKTFNYKGIGYTLSVNGEWLLTPENELYNSNLKNNIIEIRDIKSICGEIVDLVAVSWIPYRDSSMVLKYLNDNQHKYLLYVGEEQGGACGDDAFFDYIDENYELIWVSEKYKSFSCIYDKIILYRKLN